MKLGSHAYKREKEGTPPNKSQLETQCQHFPYAAPQVFRTIKPFSGSFVSGASRSSSTRCRPRGLLQKKKKNVNC